MARQNGSLPSPGFCFLSTTENTYSLQPELSLENKKASPFDPTDTLPCNHTHWENVAQDHHVQTEHSYAPWESLPFDILLKIFSYLDLYDREQVEKTCQTWMQCCQISSLWKEMSFHFKGSNSIEVVAKAQRLIEEKGHHLQRLKIKLDRPFFTPAWLTSECVRHLLDCIVSHSSATQTIEYFSITDLNFYQDWRMFTMSKNSILQSLSDFLSRLKHLNHLNLAFCKLGVDNGMRLLRILKYSRCKQTVRHLEIHNFFHRRYFVRGNRFSALLCSGLPALEEIGLDARYLTEQTLRRLTEKSIYRRRLKYLKIYFQHERVYRFSISRRCWQDAAEACPDLRVALHVHKWLSRRLVKTLWTEAMPLKECIINWYPPHRIQRLSQRDLAFLIIDLGERFSAMLDSLTIQSQLRPTPDVESAILYTVASCRNLTDVNISLPYISPEVMNRVRSISTQRSRQLRRPGAN